MAGMGENEIKTPKEQFPNLVQDFLAKSNPRWEARSYWEEQLSHDLY